MHVDPGGGRSDEVISISIPDTNLAIDRSLALKVLGGGFSRSLVVSQDGLREPFVSSDGFVLCGSDGLVFAGLKSDL